MLAYLKQSVAAQSRLVGPFIDDTDFKTVKTALTILNTDVKLSKEGGASVNKNAGGGTHRHNGMYSLTFDAVDTDTTGELCGSVLVAGALLVVFKFVVLDAAGYDALVSGLTPSNIKRNQALARYPFRMTSASTHAPLSGLTVSCTRSIDGSAFAVGTLTNAGEHVAADGTYLVDFGPADLNGKTILLKAVASGADITHERIITVP